MWASIKFDFKKSSFIEAYVNNAVFSLNISQNNINFNAMQVHFVLFIKKTKIFRQCHHVAELCAQFISLSRNLKLQLSNAFSDLDISHECACDTEERGHPNSFEIIFSRRVLQVAREKELQFKIGSALKL